MGVNQSFSNYINDIIKEGRKNFFQLTILRFEFNTRNLQDLLYEQLSYIKLGTYYHISKVPDKYLSECTV